MEIKLKDTIYDLTKIKKKDEDTFLYECQSLGKIKKVEEGFFTKLIYIFGFFSYSPTIEYTDEAVEAYQFFYKRNKMIKLKEKEIKFNKWEKKEV